MNSSLYTGVLGLKNHQTKMDVIGNNIANISTYGFKKGRATFADLLSRTYTAAAAPSENRGGINPLQVGLGMSTTAVTNLMMQGQLESTGRLTDVAVDGNGWFVLSEQSGNTVYTRDGAFGLDEEGNLVNANGLYVQGWTRVEVDNDHNFSVDTQRPVDDINFAIGEKLEAAATTQVGLKCNLDEESRSLIADGVDPKEGYATKNDLLVDLYDNDQVDPEWLGIREGDWIEIKVDVSGPDPTSYPTASMLGKTYTILATDGVDVYGDGTLYRYSGLIDDADLPMENITFTAGPLAGMTQVYQSADQIRGNALGNFTIDPDTGMIYSAVDLTTSTIQYDIDAVAENTVPYQDEKYLYFQVTNDTTIGDLESSIQNALDAIDVNGTINATVTYDNDEAKFTIYNNCVSGSRDVNDIHVEINAVSGSAIRQGFLLRDSTYPMTGTRLGLVTGGLGGAMTREDVANLDYQTSTAYLDYGNVDMSTRLFGQVVRARLETTYAAANHNDGVTLAEWTGYTGTANDLAMIADTAELSVNGTVWRNVEVFTGAANEYHIETAGGVPTVYFNTADGVEPSDGDEVVFSYRTDGAPVVELTAGVGTDYTIDATTGQISLNWSSTTASAELGTNAQFTGTVNLTADYTTEDRLLEPPDAIMNSRWADFAQEWAEVSAGGSGKARTSFNNMFTAINAARDSSSPGTINDQATSSQPTSKESTRFQSADVYRTSIDVYDSLGDAHTLQFVFTHVGSNYDLTEQQLYQNRWYWRVELPYEDVFAFDSMDDVDDCCATARLSGQIEFDNDGLIVDTKLGGNTGPIAFDASPIGANGNSTEAVANTLIEINFDGHGELIDGVTQYASDFTTRAYEQNGWEMGILETFAVDQTGVIQGTYSNSVVKPIAQIALAVFPNEEGLTKLGNNTFAISANTGLPNIVPAYVGGAGSVVGGSLEQSNVDVVEEFTSMIVTQRAYQANSRMVTTSDEMLTEVINLKR